MTKDLQSRVFSYTAKASRKGNSANLEVTLFFNKVPLSSTRFVGCSSGTVTFQSDHIKVKDYTRSRLMDVTYNLQSEGTVGVEGGPKVEYEGPNGPSISAGLITLTSSEKESQSTEFKGKEAVLQATPLPDDAGVTWSVYMPRGKKAVKDFLEHHEPLEATFDCKREKVMLKFEGYPAGRVLTDARFAELGPLRMLALWIKMLPEGGLPQFQPMLPKWRFI